MKKLRLFALSLGLTSASLAAVATGGSPAQACIPGETCGDPSPGAVRVVTWLPNGDISTTTTDPKASLTVVSDEPAVTDMAVTPNATGGVTLSGGIDISSLTAPERVAAVSTGDSGCGGSPPIKTWTFSGTVRNWGTYEGAIAICKDSYTGTKAYVLDKMFMRAKGIDHTILNDTIPDTFWVQPTTISAAHPVLISQDPNNSVDDTAGACTGYSLGIGGNSASVGMSGSVCRGTMSPILSHTVSLNGVNYRSYGVKYEGHNLLMNGTTVYGIKGVGWRQADFYNSTHPYGSFRYRSVLRWSIDFDVAPLNCTIC